MTDITDEMVEAAARALCEQGELDPDEWWEALVVEAETALTAALAVLRQTHAVVPRDATPAMVAAARGARSSIMHDQNTLSTWKVMLAAAEASHDAG